MRKKIFAAMMVMVTGFALGGCAGNTAPSDTSYDESYEAEDDNYDSYGNDYDLEEDEDYDELEETETPVEGIVAMVSQTPSNQTNITQAINIDPDTGEQTVVSEFCLKVDTKRAYFWGDTQHCTTRDRFSEDYSKMAINMLLADPRGDHAGWIDTDGNFFDVSNAIDEREDGDFFDTAYIKHKAIGFKGNQFAFLDVGTNEVYYVPIDNVSSSTVVKADETDDFVRLIKQPLPDMIRLSDRIDTNTYIGDFQNYGYNYSYSAICNIEDTSETGKVESYIPEAGRYNWSGVLNSESNMVAFFSGTKGSGEVNLYKMSISDKSPDVIQLQPNDSVVVDLCAIRIGHPLNDPTLCGLGNIFDHNVTEECCLLEWK